jgi:hypothetical protein
VLFLIRAVLFFTSKEPELYISSNALTELFLISLKTSKFHILLIFETCFKLCILCTVLLSFYLFISTLLSCFLSYFVTSCLFSLSGWWAKPWYHKTGLTHTINSHTLKIYTTHWNLFWVSAHFQSLLFTTFSSLEIAIYYRFSFYQALNLHTWSEQKIQQ